MRYVFEKRKSKAVAAASGVTEDNSYFRVKFVDDAGKLLKKVDVLERSCPYTKVAAPADVPASSKTGKAFIGWSSGAYKKVTDSGMVITALYGAKAADGKTDKKDDSAAATTPAGEKAWSRLAGGSALTTMKAVVNKGWKSSEWAIVATSEGYHDALSASGLAGLLDAPVLLTPKDSLSNVTKNLIKNKKVKNVIVVGGTSAVSSGVEKQIEELGVSVKRVAGGTAYTTCKEIAKFCLANGMGASYMDVATGQSYQDALAGAALCGKNNSILVLADDRNSKNVKAVVAKNKKALQKSCYIFGGDKAVSKTVYNAVLAASK